MDLHLENDGFVCMLYVCDRMRCRMGYHISAILTTLRGFAWVVIRARWFDFSITRKEERVWKSVCLYYIKKTEEKTLVDDLGRAREREREKNRVGKPSPPTKSG